MSKACISFALSLALYILYNSKMLESRLHMQMRAATENHIHSSYNLQDELNLV